MKKLIIVTIFAATSSAHATSLTYSCKSLSEKEVGIPIFSNLTLKIGDMRAHMTGSFTSIGSDKSESIKAIAIRKFQKSTDKTTRYVISNPFEITMYLPKDIFVHSPKEIRATLGYVDGSNGFVKATGTCALRQ